MYQAISILVAAMAVAWIVSLVSQAAKRHLTNRRAWAAIGAGGMGLSAASWFVTEERMGGTLLWRLHGSPKVFSWECLSAECTSRGPSFTLLYFLGNSFFYAAGLLLLWTLIAVVLSHRESTPSP
jgi:hypothetical protein